MNVIVCVDDNGGLLFNNRRQSRDKSVIEKISEIVGENKLYISGFSESLFADSTSAASVMIDEAILETAGEEDFCFVENKQLLPYENRIHTLYLFKWNRSYPFDMRFDLNLNEAYRLVQTEDFVGNSHDKITLEMWER